MIKEITGHRSDALDVYEVTSEQQKKRISEVLATKTCTVREDVMAENQNKCKTKQEESVTKVVNPSASTIEHLGKVIDNVVSKKKDDQKVLIQLEIEISNK